MSNAFMGQRQFSPSPMMGGGMVGHTGMGFGPNYGGGFDASRDFAGMGGFGGFGGGYGSPYGGGYGTQFGGFDMGGGFGGFGGYQRPSPMPQFQPTVNDLFGQYFSQQYYGGPAFNPFAATSMFGGGFGGGRGGGMGARMRRRRQMFEDFFQPEQPPQTLPAPQPTPQMRPQPIRPPQMAPQPSEPMMYAGGSPNFDMTGTREPQPLPQPAPMFQPLPQPPPLPQPYMGGFSFPFDQTLPAKSEALPAPAAHGVESIMPVPVQDAPVTAPPVYDFAPLPQPAPFVEPPPPAPIFQPLPQPAPFIPMIPSIEPPLPTYFEPLPFIPAPAPPVQDLFIEPAPEPVVPSPFVRPSRGMFGTGFR